MSKQKHHSFAWILEINWGSHIKSQPFWENLSSWLHREKVLARSQLVSFLLPLDQILEFLRNFQLLGMEQENDAQLDRMGSYQQLDLAKRSHHRLSCPKCWGDSLFRRSAWALLPINRRWTSLINDFLIQQLKKKAGHEILDKKGPKTSFFPLFLLCVPHFLSKIISSNFQFASIFDSFQNGSHFMTATKSLHCTPLGRSQISELFGSAEPN